MISGTHPLTNGGAVKSSSRSSAGGRAETKETGREAFVEHVPVCRPYTKHTPNTHTRSFLYEDGENVRIIQPITK